MKLGKQPRKQDDRTLSLAKYLKPALPRVPLSIQWAAGMSNFGMMANDAIGDCTAAAAGHMLQVWTAKESGAEVTLPDDQIVAAYSTVSGYDPATGANDNGAAILDVLNYWRKTGIGGHKIEAFVEVAPRNTGHIRAAIDLFGGIDIGLQLPAIAQDEVGSLWRVPPAGPIGDAAPGTWGGHSVTVCGYDVHGLTCITWGQLQKMTWLFFMTYCDEAYGILAPEWTARLGKNPLGFNVAQLQQDLQLVTGK
jgi:hypothetical protein